MKFAALIERWTQSVPAGKTMEQYAVRLPIEDAAGLRALAELFSGHSPEDLITDLLAAALREVESAMPYKPGPKVISRDEQGDPIYEDVGLTPQYERLKRKYKEELSRRAAS